MGSPSVRTMEKAAADPTSTATASGHEDLTPLVPYAAEIEYVTVKQATRKRADLLRIPSRSRMSLPTAMFPRIEVHRGGHLSSLPGQSDFGSCSWRRRDVCCPSGDTAYPGMNAHGDAESMRRYGARIETDSVVTYRHLHSSFFDNCVDRTTCVRPGVFLTVTQCFTQGSCESTHRFRRELGIVGV